MPIHDELNEMSSSGSYVSAPTAVQYAVDCGKSRLMVALLEEGAAETLGPTKPFIAIAGGEVLAQPCDFFAYVESRRNVNTSEMLAGARAALMRRHIVQAQLRETAETAAAAAAHHRTRRASL